jgi:hypothetical protein
MSKDADARIEETVAFVSAHPVPAATSADDHDLIVKSLRDWKRLTSEATRAKLSALLSQNDSPNRARQADTRATLRAATLLKCAIATPESGWAGVAVSDRATPAAGAASLYAAALGVARDYVHSTPEFINRMLGELKGHPRRFLSGHKLTINGGNRAGNPLLYKIAMKDGAYSFDCYGANNGRVSVSAVNVRATAYTDVRANLGALTPVDSASGPNCDLLLTTQFTGCTFAFMKSADGSNLLAAHIDPGRGSGVQGRDVSRAVRQGGGFGGGGNGGEFQAYGRVPSESQEWGYPESAAQMTIVGVKKAGEWRLYAQITALDGGLTALRIDA